MIVGVVLDRPMMIVRALAAVGPVMVVVPMGVRPTTMVMVVMMQRASSRQVMTMAKTVRAQRR